jgi:DinB superfamily
MRHAMLLVAVLVAQPAAAPEDDFKAIFAKHWRMAKEFTLAVAEAMPAESYDFKPTPEQMTFGRLMTHIGAQNSDSCAVATGTTALPEPAARDKATAIKYLTETFDACAAALEAMPPERLGSEVYKFQDSRCSRTRRSGTRSRTWPIIGDRRKSTCA